MGDEKPTMNMTILGIAGLSGSGKDTAAAFFVREYGFVRVGFADTLKQEVLMRFPQTLRTILWTLHCKEPTEEDVRKAVYEDKPPEIRVLLQEYGTEVRRHDDPEYWVRQWTSSLRQWSPDQRFVVPDVRFRNEAEKIMELGGWVILLTRPGLKRLFHVSESSMSNWTYDAVFDNSEDIASLEYRLQSWFDAVLTRRRRL